MSKSICKKINKRLRTFLLFCACSILMAIAILVSIYFLLITQLNSRTQGGSNTTAGELTPSLQDSDERLGTFSTDSTSGFWNNWTIDGSTNHGYIYPHGSWSYPNSTNSSFTLVTNATQSSLDNSTIDFKSAHPSYNNLSLSELRVFNASSLETWTIRSIQTVEASPDKATIRSKQTMEASPDTAIMQSLQTVKLPPDTTASRSLQIFETSTDTTNIRSLQTVEASLATANIRSLQTVEASPDTATMRFLQTVKVPPDTETIQSLQTVGTSSTKPSHISSTGTQTSFITLREDSNAHDPASSLAGKFRLKCPAVYHSTPQSKCPQHHHHHPQYHNHPPHHHPPHHHHHPHYPHHHQQGQLRQHPQQQLQGQRR